MRCYLKGHGKPKALTLGPEPAPWSERVMNFSFSSRESVNFKGEGIVSELLARLR